ncbi:MAG: hypothetical protein ABL931_14405 [Usitatibacteraceae bacterium]
MLALSLFAVFTVFCIIMGAVLALCIRERKRALASQVLDARRDEDADNRVAIVLFGAIFLGALLALTTAYLVFFREWN